MGANVRNEVSTAYPTHFSPTDFLPPWPTDPNAIDAAYKTAYLVKYDTNGQFQWKKALQGDVNLYNKDSFIYDITIDSNDNIHFIAGFLNGTHLDNTITVPSTFTNAYQYYAVKFDTAGNYNSTLLPVTGHFAEPSFTFRYDEPRNRYLIGGFRSRVNANEDIPLTYDGTAFTENAYILAIDATNGNEIWRREMEATAIANDNRIYDLVVDETNGDIYISGKLVATGQPGEYIRIKDPKNTSATPFTFNIAVWGNMPFIAKLNSSGTAQWARTPSGYTWSTAQTGDYWGFGLALRGGEVAFATMGSHTIWDGFSINRPQGHQSDPMLMRFSKQTGNVLAMHDIEGSTGNNHMLTAVAVDNDGNYVVGGCYQGNLFTGGGNVGLLGAIGKYDFFVAKLAASVCGTSVSNEEFNKLNVNVYPNPTTDIVNIETAETLQSYEVYNVLGQQIQKGNFNGNTQINLHGATAGTYFIKVTTTQGSADTVKVVKK
ncbi:Por secretion system C-terminal sorting domain-containing protein [Paenimyroides aquimaris]|uniref:Por secretion system C-terminal sorting domain-containing protein n=1 Tax=Paenimyroides marinum TaxID=1159016 RepID=A0A1H6J0U4_9FLAO|nr:Por secretion system C-terminal sorting domain-containing protein [Paenimyroides aquimaris]